MEIIYSSSSSASHGLAIPFVWESRGALTRLPSAGPGPAWGRWCHWRLGLIPSARVVGGGDEGNMFYRVRYKPTWLQTSGTDIRSSENVSVTPAAFWMRAFQSQAPPKGKGTWRVLVLSIPVCHPACFLYQSILQFIKYTCSSHWCIWRSYRDPGTAEHAGHGRVVRQAWFLFLGIFYSIRVEIEYSKNPAC